jgi:hypothetical protein
LDRGADRINDLVARSLRVEIITIGRDLDMARWSDDVPADGDVLRWSSLRIILIESVAEPDQVV